MIFKSPYSTSHLTSIALLHFPRLVNITRFATTLPDETPQSQDSSKPFPRVSPSLDVTSEVKELREKLSYLQQENLELSTKDTTSIDSLNAKDQEIGQLKERLMIVDLIIPIDNILGVNVRTLLLIPINESLILNLPMQSTSCNTGVHETLYSTAGILFLSAFSFSLYAHHNLYVILRDGLSYQCQSFRNWDSFFGNIFTTDFTLSFGIRFDFAIICCFISMFSTASGSTVFQAMHTYSRMTFSAYIGAFLGCAYLHIFKTTVLAFTNAPGFALPTVSPDAYLLIVTGLFKEFIEIISFAQRNIPLDSARDVTVTLEMKFNALKFANPFKGNARSDKSSYYIIVGLLSLLSFNVDNKVFDTQVVRQWFRLFSNVDSFIENFGFAGALRTSANEFRFIAQMSVNSNFWNSPYKFAFHRNSFKTITAWYLWLFKTLELENILFADIKQSSNVTFPNCQLFMTFNTDNTGTGIVYFPTDLLQDHIWSTLLYLNVLTLRLTSSSPEKTKLLSSTFENRYGRVKAIVNSSKFIGEDFCKLMPLAIFNCRKCFTPLYVHKIVLQALDLNPPSLTMFVYEWSTVASKTTKSIPYITYVTIKGDKFLITNKGSSTDCLTLDKSAIINIVRHFNVSFQSEILETNLIVHLDQR